MSRLSYCLEVVSTGRKKNMETLQGVQSAAARWVSQTKRRDWHLKSGLKKLEWLSMCQQAAYASLKTAMKVLREKKPERLYKTLVEEVGEEWKIKVLDEKRVSKMKASTKKAWSIRSLRWMAQMPDKLIKKNIKLKSSKEELKKWIRETVPVKGDRILWGQKLTGGMRRKKKRGQAETEGDKDGNGRNENTEEKEEEERDGADQAEQEQDEVEHEGVEQEDVGQEEVEQQKVEQENDREVEKEIRKELVESKVNWKKWLKKKNGIKVSRKQREMKERSWRIRPGGRVPGSLPRAGVEPSNPGKGGSLSPSSMEDGTSGEILILWCPSSLTFMYHMVTSVRQQVQRRKGDMQEEQADEELEMRRRPRRKMKAWPKVGVG